MCGGGEGFGGRWGLGFEICSGGRWAGFVNSRSPMDGTGDTDSATGRTVLSPLDSDVDVGVGGRIA